tara:strand:- start:63592 stop:65766 length:2175 start_codon:yes stop_codon:yes gene_type:complete
VYKDEIYDIETYPNVFTMCVISEDEKEEWEFEISDRKNQTEQLLDYLRRCVVSDVRQVGFNNRGFDYTIIHYIIQKAKKAKGIKINLCAKELYDVTQEYFDRQKGDNKFPSVKEKDVVIPQLDLFLIHHFDNKARATSLKMLEFNMRSGEIEDLPFPPGTNLTNTEIDVLLKYNKKDVKETLKFYKYSEEAIKLREDLTIQFGFDCTNFNDTKIGKQLFIQRLEKENPGCCYSTGKFGRRMKQTKRDEIVIKDCLFDYIDFSRNRPEFNAVHEWFKKQVITETKGVFSDLLEHQLGDVAKYAEMKVKKQKFKTKPDQKEINEVKKEFPMGWYEEVELKGMQTLKDEFGNSVKEKFIDAKGREKQRVVKVPKKSYYWCYHIVETLNVVINGFRFDFGVGGIHGAAQGTHRSTNKRKLRTLDVASYYPNMAIANEVYPEHLGKTFCEVYKDLYFERKKYDKKSALNKALKLALNGTYGDSNNEFSPLYDPAYTMSITIGGQLSLCMLMGALIDHCGADIIMCNTDGFEYFVDVDKIEKADKIVKRWEEVTGLEMEGDTYSVMYIRDVNNYLSVTEDNKVKTKGAYEVLPFDELGWNKNHSSMVIAKAVYNELIEGGDIESFIRNHDDPYDFMLRTKVPRSSRLVMADDQGNETLLQNICRYYPSTEGGKLIKIMPPLVDGGDERRLGIDVDWNVTTCNNMSDFNWGINYDYYITEAMKLLEAVKSV